MKFKRLDHVKRNLQHTFWDGFVLGYILRLDGSYVVLVERFDKTMFLCTEDQLQLHKRHACKHDQGFIFKPMPPRWECGFGCGYAVNFNPEDVNSIAFNEAKPGPTIELKPSKY
jgi:hypothetical protein